MKPTATKWVSRDKNGQMVEVRVVDMEDVHLWRWIRYFRRKWRESGFKGSDAQLDATIRQELVTAPAIYAEAAKRGVIDLPDAPELSPDALRQEFIREVRTATTEYALSAALKHLIYLPPPADVLQITARTAEQLLAVGINQVWLANAAKFVFKRSVAIVLVDAVTSPKAHKKAHKKGAGHVDSSVTMVAAAAPGVRLITLDED